MQASKKPQRICQTADFAFVSLYLSQGDTRQYPTVSTVGKAVSDVRESLWDDRFAMNEV